MCSEQTYNMPPLALLPMVVELGLDGGKIRLPVWLRVLAMSGVIWFRLSPALLRFGGGVSPDAEGALCDIVAGTF
jgi:hypothetical protein